MPTTLITITCANPACGQQTQKRWRSDAEPQPQYCSLRCWYAVRKTLPVWRKYYWTDDERQRLREACRDYGGLKRAWRAGDFGNKPYAICKREAKRLGIIRRTHDELWAPEESVLCLRLAWAGRPLERIQRELQVQGYHRSLEGIRQHLWKLEVHGKRGRYTLTDVAEALQTDYHRVKAWVDQGWLTATPTSTVPHARWYVTAADLRAFCVAHALDVAQGDMRLCFVLSLFAGTPELLVPDDEIAAD